MSIRTKDDTSNRLICLYILCTKVAPAPNGDRLPSDTAEIDALFVDIESSKKKREFKLCQQIMNKIHDLRERNHKKSSPVAALEIQLEDAKARRDFARCRTLQRQIEAAKAPSARARAASTGIAAGGRTRARRRSARVAELPERSHG